jgi:carbohydrate kinase (thermoresistant glucokinase family)
VTDEDRWGRLDPLAEWTQERDQRGASTVMACSAPRRRYRDVLRRGGLDTCFVLLVVGPDVVRDRMCRRASGVPPSLLVPQLATLEPLEADEPGVTLDAGRPVEELATATLTRLAQWGHGVPPGR